MTKLLVPIVAGLATTAIAVTPSSVQLEPFSTAGSSVFSAENHQPTGASRTVPSGPHPTFNWPPHSTGNNTGSACAPIQYKFPQGNNANSTRAEAVKDLYRASWEQYTKYCFGKDTLHPLSNTCENDLFGWGASIVDGVDTAIIMNLTDIVTQQLTYIAQTDYTTSFTLVDGFDAIIRYLAGLISAYDLLTSDYVPKGTYDQSLIDAVLKQAQTLGNHLKPQFNTSSGLPASQINITTGEITNSQFTDPLNGNTYNDTNVAVAGTLNLEFYRLADLTGDDTFRQLADRAESNLVNPNPAPVYPNLVGSELDTDTGNFLTFDFGWKAGIDSFLEYLIKTYYYNPNLGTTQFYKDFWVGASESTIQNIALSPDNFTNLLFLSQGDDSGNLEWAMDDYACFAGGNFLLGGKLLDMPDIYELGIRVTDSCHWLYNHTETGLGPVSWAWYNASNQAYDPDDNNNATRRAEAAKNGFFITGPIYDAFPEPLESVFYAYRITGDSIWQEYNWNTFQSIKNLLAPTGYDPAISDVNQPGSFVDAVPSFFYAEVLKYLYLTFTPADIISLDDWVFNTEAHPFKRNAGCAPQQGWNGTSGWNSTSGWHKW